MVMKPVRLLCYMFLWTWKCTTFKRIPIILIVLTNKNVALIYSVTICQQKTKDCALSRYFQHKLQHCCSYHWCLPLFIRRFKELVNRRGLLKLLYSQTTCFLLSHCSSTLGRSCFSCCYFVCLGWFSNELAANKKTEDSNRNRRWSEKIVS